MADRPDMTPLPDLLHGRSRAGPVREQRPVYVDLLPPCNAGCPAGENIQAWLAHAEAGRPELAWRQLVADNPMPAIHGRVCYHPCETVCNRASLDSAVSVHAVERFLGRRRGPGHEPGHDGGHEPGHDGGHEPGHDAGLEHRVRRQRRPLTEARPARPTP